MKAIYFSSNKDSFSFKKVILRHSSHLLATFAPKASNIIAEKVFCTPVKSSSRIKDMKGFTRSDFVLRGEKLAVYEKGNSDKIILFSHGWSGSAKDFSRFYDLYVEAGYKVVSIDHIAHGNSSGKVSNFYFFYEGLKELFSLYNTGDQKVVGVVAHSMGGGATISAKLPEDVKLCLIAPAVSVFDYLYDNAKRFGLSRRMVKRFLQSYERKLDLSIENIDPKNIFHSLNNPLHVIQCVDDSFVSLDDCKRLMPELKINEFSLFDKLGHFRILRSKEVAQKSLEFIHGSK